MTSLWKNTNDKTTIVEDKFFKGANIAKRMVSSIFGKIKNAMISIMGKEEFDTYELPKIIVMGDESTGKSSLLENIIKCPILPKDSKICTKCPIRVIMKSGDKKDYTVEYAGDERYYKKQSLVAKKIQEIMDTFGEHEISENVITVTIIAKNLPSFEFYDLPGIRAYPEEMAMKTEALCSKYLSMDNCIAMCVVPATQPRLTSSKSIALVKKHNKCEDTIIVLTMIDRLRSNIEQLLINRIMRTSDEFESLEFAGCVGVINRDNATDITLSCSDKAERAWFDKNIGNVLPSQYKAKKSVILNNLSVVCLIDQLDILYNKYINTNWKPNMVAQMTYRAHAVQGEIDAIGGELPSDLLAWILVSNTNTSTTFNIDVSDYPEYGIGGYKNFIINRYVKRFLTTYPKKAGDYLDYNYCGNYNIKERMNDLKFTTLTDLGIHNPNKHQDTINFWRFENTTSHYVKYFENYIRDRIDIYDDDIINAINSRMADGTTTTVDYATIISHYIFPSNMKVQIDYFRQCNDYATIWPKNQPLSDFRLNYQCLLNLYKKHPEILEEPGDPSSAFNLYELLTGLDWSESESTIEMRAKLETKLSDIVSKVSTIEGL